MPDRRPLWLRDAVAARNLAEDIVRQCGWLAERAPAGGSETIRAVLIHHKGRRLLKLAARMERRYRREQAAKPCARCGGPVEADRRVYAEPTCHRCLPPPPHLEWTPGGRPDNSVGTRPSAEAQVSDIEGAEASGSRGILVDTE